MRKIILVALFVSFVTIHGVHYVFAQTTSGVTSASSITEPSISVTHPIAGNSYKPGDTLTVNWITTGVSADTDVDVILTMDPRSTNRGMYNGCIGGPFSACSAMNAAGERFLPDMHIVTKNTGSVSFTLPDSYLPSGKYYFELQAFSLVNNVLTTYADTGMDSTKMFTVVSASSASSVSNPGLPGTKNSSDQTISASTSQQTQITTSQKTTIPTVQQENTSSMQQNTSTQIVPQILNTVPQQVPQVSFWARIKNFFGRLF